MSSRLLATFTTSWHICPFHSLSVFREQSHTCCHPEHTRCRAENRLCATTSQYEPCLEADLQEEISMLITPTTLPETQGDDRCCVAQSA
jgi:hypothetical protein